jgi:hypothetical protein
MVHASSRGAKDKSLPRRFIRLQASSTRPTVVPSRYDFLVWVYSLTGKVRSDRRVPEKAPHTGNILEHFQDPTISQPLTTLAGSSNQGLDVKAKVNILESRYCYSVDSE